MYHAAMTPHRALNRKPEFILEARLAPSLVRSLFGPPGGSGASEASGTGSERDL